MSKEIFFICLIVCISSHFIQDCDRNHDHSEDYGYSNNYDGYYGSQNKYNYDGYNRQDSSNYDGYRTGRNDYESSTANGREPINGGLNKGQPISKPATEINILQAGRVNLLADNGKYLARCQ
jgi:hypothetical protein